MSKLRQKGHIYRNCWAICVNAHGEGEGNDSNEGDNEFPGVDDQALRIPPRGNEPREQTFPNGTFVTWCSECGSWGDHFRADHPADDEPGDGAAPETGNVGMRNDKRIIANDKSISNAEEENSAFTRLLCAGLI